MNTLKSHALQMPVLLLVMLIAVMGFGFGGKITSQAASSSSSTSSTIEGTYRYDLAWDVLGYLNSSRNAAGVASVRRDDYLTEVAMLRAAEVSVKNSHIRPNGKSCFTAGDTTYYKAENIATGWETAERVNDAWLGSSSHYETMMNDSYTGVGVGCFEDMHGNLYWAEAFGVYQSPAVKKDNYSTVTASGKNITITRIENYVAGIRIQWDKIQGVSGYYIYRRTDNGSYKKIKTIKNCATVSYKDRSVQGMTGKTYQYKVVPFTLSDGKTGSGTAATMVRVDRPKSKIIKDGTTGSLNVRWSTVPNVTGYKVCFSENEDFSKYYYYKVEGSSSSSFKIPNLSKGTYYIKICAYKTKYGQDYDSAYTNVRKVSVLK